MADHDVRKLAPGEDRWQEVWSDGPPPGSFGLSRIGGVLGKLIAAGQAFSGDGSRWTHAFIVLDHETVLEAMPGGARLAPLASRLNHAEVVFSDKPVQTAIAARKAHEVMSDFTDPDAFWSYVEQLQRRSVVENAEVLIGTGYGYLQYLALGLIALGFSPKWLERYIANRGRMICSQLVDEIMLRSGIQLFDDGRLPQQVTPGDLAHYAGIV